MAKPLFWCAAAASVLAGGCEEGPEYGCTDLALCAAPDAGPTHAPDAGPRACAGTCMQDSPAYWSSPLALWIGAPGSAPSCPPEAPKPAYDGYADPDDTSLACGACACSPPTGTCAPPATLTLANATCAGAAAAGVVTTSLPSPASWDGGCAPEAAPDAGAICNGSDCAQSLTIPPLAIEEACAPSLPPPPPPMPGGPPASVTWNKAARACSDPAPGPCATAGAVCAPSSAEGFVTCIRQDGDVSCPSGWPVKHVFYGDATDTRGCAACSCGSPAGSTCTALVSVYTDGACTMLEDGVTVPSSGPICVDLAPGATFSSGNVTGVVYDPGTCTPSGGGPTGSVTPTEPATFCCLG